MNQRKPFSVSNACLILCLMLTELAHAKGSEVLESAQNLVNTQRIAGSPVVGYWHIDHRFRNIPDLKRLISIPTLSDHCPNKNKIKFADWFNEKFFQHPLIGRESLIYPVSGNARGELIFQIEGRGIVVFGCGNFEFYALENSQNRLPYFAGETRNESLWFYRYSDTTPGRYTNMEVVKFHDGKFSTMPSPIGENVSAYLPRPLLIEGFEDDVCGFSRGGAERAIACIDALGRVAKHFVEPSSYQGRIGPYAISATNFIVLDNSSMHSDDPELDKIYSLSISPGVDGNVVSRLMTTLRKGTRIKRPSSSFNRSIFTLNNQLVMHSKSGIYTVAEDGKCHLFRPNNEPELLNIFKSDDSHIIITSKDTVFRLPIPIPSKLAQACS